jgi:hypothetical protein
LDAPKNHFKDKAEEFLHLIRKFQGGSITKLAKHFLDPLVVPVLEARVERARNAPATAPTDLAKVKGARPKDAKCALKPGEEGPGVKKKYTAGEICRMLKLDREGARQFQDVIQKAKAAHMRVMQIPMKGGKTPLERFLEIQSLPPAKRATAVGELFQKLSEPIPGREHSHLEYITRIKVSLAKQLRVILTREQFALLESRVEDFLDQIEPGSGKSKPHIRELAERLELTRDQVDTLTRVVRARQVAVYQILATPNAQGRKPLEMMLAVQGLPEDKRASAFAAFLAILGEEIPGRDTTYQQEVDRLKGEVTEVFRKQLTADQFRRFQAMTLDVLDIQLDEK